MKTMTKGVQCQRARLTKGGFRDGKRNGHGVASLPSGERLEAEWQDGIPNGPGSFIEADGSRCDGQIREGHPHGKGGVAVRADGTRYEGEWRDGKPDGAGTLTRPGEPPFTGTWARGCYSGDGRSAAFGTRPEACSGR